MFSINSIAFRDQFISSDSIQTVLRISVVIHTYQVPIKINLLLSGRTRRVWSTISDKKRRYTIEEMLLVRPHGDVWKSVKKVDYYIQLLPLLTACLSVLTYLGERAKLKMEDESQPRIILE
jgi:hypothetical protein